MNNPFSADDLAAGYEALRAAVVGSRPTESPKGLALLLGQGLPGWIRAWTTPAALRSPAAAMRQAESTAAPSSELVRLLAEMALGQRRSVAVP
ncbi:MAG TPA: hypothetical protein VIK45_07925 [Candidatus Dormibacteraeota bacterium]|jgi:hypothetical protein